MDGQISKKQLKGHLGEDWETLLERTAEALNQARPGCIIDDSEELVREAVGEFRRRLFEKALELRSQREAFSPSGGPESQAGSVEE